MGGRGAVSRDASVDVEDGGRRNGELIKVNVKDRG